MIMIKRKTDAKFAFVQSGKALSSESYGTGFDNLSCWHDVCAYTKTLSVKKNCLEFKCSYAQKKITLKFNVNPIEFALLAFFHKSKETLGNSGVGTLFGQK